MTHHPRRSRSRLAQYGARLRTVDGVKVVEMVDPNDSSRSRYQYRRCNDTVWRRVLTADGETITDWTALTADELRQLVRTRGDYHPILDPLGL